MKLLFSPAQEAGRGYKKLFFFCLFKTHFTHRKVLMYHSPMSVCNDTIDPLLLCYFRASLDDKLYDRDLETALTLSLLSSPRTQDGEPTTKTGEYSAGLSISFICEVQSCILLLFIVFLCSADDCDVSQPNQCSPPVLIHCSADASHIGNNKIVSFYWSQTDYLFSSVFL